MLGVNQINFEFMENKLAVTKLLDKQHINALNIVEITNQLRYESKNRQLLDWFHLKKNDAEQMKESVRHNLEIKDKRIDAFLNRNHIHSAGLALVLSEIIIKDNLQNTLPIAVTGGIDKKGDVLSIGVLKEKIQIASLSGIPFMIVPSENAKEAAKIQKEIHTNIQIFNVANIDEAIKVVKKINNKNK
ncbi:S16 family serine protease [Rummeliibacillus pycnus]|uniref:S16 family serine protease n=1 Tax=Rummeliibacillus pycnus TaxID=101070 RepID=UPI003D27E9F5